MHKKETLIKDQKGIASMVIVILIMTLLSLIVLSMTKNANREQRQALDRQLNSQAFYAAESGINDAKDYYTKYAQDPTTPAPEEKSDCSGLSGAAPGDQFPHGYSSKVGANLAVTVNNYSCVLYDSTPNSLIFSSVSTDNSVLMPLQDKSGDPITSLTFTWKRPNNSTYTFSGCPSSGFPKSLTDCDAGALRIELIDPSDTSRDALISNDFLAFVSPSPDVGSNPANPAYGNGVGTSDQGVSWRGGCSSPSGTDGKCSITINGINRTRLMMHLRSIYNNNEVQVTGVTTDPVTLTQTVMQFKNAQLMVDATGRAADVLKRIQVRAPLNQYGNGVYPEFSLQTADGICKLLQIIPPGFVDAQSSNGGCSL